MNHPTHLYPTSEPVYKSGVTLKYSQGPTGEEHPQGELESGLVFLAQRVPQPWEWRQRRIKSKGFYPRHTGLARNSVLCCWAESWAPHGSPWLESSGNGRGTGLRGWVILVGAGWEPCISLQKISFAVIVKLMLSHCPDIDWRSYAGMHDPSKIVHKAVCVCLSIFLKRESIFSTGSSRSLQHPFPPPLSPKLKKKQ